MQGPQNVKYFTSIVIPKSSQNHLRSKHLNVKSFQISFTYIIQCGMNPHGDTLTEDDAMTTLE